MFIPDSYTTIGDTTTYHYKFSALRGFVTLGRLGMPVGWVLVKTVGNTEHYRGYIRNARGLRLFRITSTLSDKLPSPQERIDTMKQPPMWTKATKIIWSKKRTNI